MAVAMGLQQWHHITRIKIPLTTAMMFCEMEGMMCRSQVLDLANALWPYSCPTPG